MLSSPPYLDQALELVKEWRPESEDNLLEDEDPQNSRIEAYWSSAWVWHELGIQIALKHREQIAEIWRHNPELRDLLVGILCCYPCQEFLRPFRRIRCRRTPIRARGCRRSYLRN